MAERWYIALFILAIPSLGAPGCCGSNVLVFPYEQGKNSRLFNMQKMANMVADHGHNVTLMINTRTRYVITSTKFNVLEYTIPNGRKTLEPDAKEFQDIFSNKSFTGDVMTFVLHDFLFPYCISLLEQKELINSLKEQKFDLILLDVLAYCGFRLSDFWGKPTLLYFNMGSFGDSEIFYPAPPSFVRIRVCLVQLARFPSTN